MTALARPWKPHRPARGKVPSGVSPPGVSPSRVAKRTVAAAGALLGLAVSTWLAAYQLGLVARPWDPFFGDGTRQVLTSSFSRALPVPDAALGAVAYALEVALIAWGGRDRWRTHPRVVYAYAALAGAMALGSVGLVLLQAFVVHAFCTLCLVSAALSFALATPAATELVAALRARRRGGR